MHKKNPNRVVFYSKEDLAGGHQLSKGEYILRNDTKSVYEDINDVLELYHLKKYIDDELFLKSWTQNDITDFKQKAKEYGRIVGQFMSKTNDNNFVSYYEQLLRSYLNSFWEIINNQSLYKQISSDNFAIILKKNEYEIRHILTFKKLVAHYNNVLKDFLITYSNSAEILLSIYEKKEVFNKQKKLYLPKNLTIQDKENIISNYVDKENSNLNYLRLIKNTRSQKDFKISDKIRLKAKRKEEAETNKIFKESVNVSQQKYGVSIAFKENTNKIKEGHNDGLVSNYSYSLDYIKQNNGIHSLFLNFKYLFEYLDYQNRINLVSKRNEFGGFEMFMGIQSQNEYRCGIAFNMSEMTSHTQIVAYCKTINDLENSLENILQNVFTSEFQEKYNFANNSRLSMPSSTVSNFEKVRLLAPEFESILKQYKLFVEDGSIDFELLQMSSTPSAIKDIPSLLEKKYIYFNEDNKELVGCSNLFFSNQSLLAYVDPFKEKDYHTFFNLLTNEKVNFNNYEEHHKPELNYLIDKGFLSLDKENFIQITNIQKVLILKDLYENEVASFYHYSLDFQKEVEKMESHDMVFFENSLFSKPEQSYFNYLLNKSEFTNGLDLRNSYLHGTQANPEELQKHEYSYFTYMKLLVLILLKIEDDLLLSKIKKMADG